MTSRLWPAGHHARRMRREVALDVLRHPDHRHRHEPGDVVGGEHADDARHRRRPSTVSIRLMSACAWSLNRIAAWSVPGGRDVTDVLGLAADEARALLGRDRNADAPRSGGRRRGGGGHRRGGRGRGTPDRMVSAARWTARTAFWYPLMRRQRAVHPGHGSPHRSGPGCDSEGRRRDMIMPGRARSRSEPRTLARTRPGLGCSAPVHAGHPLDGRDRRALGLRGEDEAALHGGTPSRWTVHAPHSPVSQPTLVPVRPRPVTQHVRRAAPAARRRPFGSFR